MTSASGNRFEMQHAFAAARATAQSISEAPAWRASRFSRASSIVAGSTAKATSAARSNAARAALAEARITRSAVAAMAAHQQFVDRRCSLLDRAAGYIDDRPMVLGEGAPRRADLAAHRLEVGIIGGLIMIEHAEPVATQ